MTTYMLDTDICVQILSLRPAALLQRMSNEVAKNNRFVISAITYAELLRGHRPEKLSANQLSLIDEFVRRLDEIVPWDQYAARDTYMIAGALEIANVSMSSNTVAVAGHAMATDSVLIANQTSALRIFAGLSYECWDQS